MSKMYVQGAIVIFWTCFKSTDFNCIVCSFYNSEVCRINPTWSDEYTRNAQCCVYSLVT